MVNAFGIAGTGALLACLAWTHAGGGASRTYDDPVPGGENGYVVTVDGARAVASDVRCSAIPFNRRWPGHQRDISQTEICGMARFEFDGGAHVEVTAPRDFSSFRIRPLSRGVKAVRKGRTLSFDIVKPGGYSVEFDGYHRNLHLFADPPEMAKAPKDAPNVRHYGPGVHDVGIVALKSGETVYIASGAVVYGGFHASNATDIAILGRGIIDGGRLKEKILFPATGDGNEDVHNAKRSHTIDFRNCRNIRIDGVVFRDSLVYSIAMYGCEEVAINNVKIVGQWRYNTDGIDLHNCRRARVTNCFARTYDDTFCFKAHEGYGYCEDGVFERCVAWNDWGKAFEVGVECRADHLRRLTFRDCDCIHAVASVMDVTNVDYGRVSEVLFDGIRVEADEAMPAPQMQKNDASTFDHELGRDRPTALFGATVQFHHEYSREYGGKWSGGGHIDGVTVRNVSVTSNGRKPRVSMLALNAAHRPENVVFENLTVDGKTVTGPADVELAVGKNAVPPRFETKPSPLSP